MLEIYTLCRLICAVAINFRINLWLFIPNIINAFLRRPNFQEKHFLLFIYSISKVLHLDYIFKEKFFNA